MTVVVTKEMPGGSGGGFERTPWGVFPNRKIADEYIALAVEDAYVARFSRKEELFEDELVRTSYWGYLTRGFESWLVEPGLLAPAESLGLGTAVCAAPADLDRHVAALRSGEAG